MTGVVLKEQLATIAKLRSELASARAQVSEFETERENTRRCLLAYNEAHGFEHDTYSDDGGEEMPCPEDDTCECWYFEPLNAAMRPLAKEST